MLLAAGSGSRVGHDVNKVFLPLAGRPVFSWSLHWARALPQLCRIVLVIAERDRAAAEAALAREPHGLDVELVVGGETRHDSEWSALSVLSDDIHAGTVDVVVIHDAARPLAGTAIFAEVISTAYEVGGALPVRPQPALLPVDPATAPPVDVVAVQTPQAFRAGPLLQAYEGAHEHGFVGTDTASCMERFTDVQVRCVAGSALNIKITFPEDVPLAEHLMANLDGDFPSR